MAAVQSRRVLKTCGTVLLTGAMLQYVTGSEAHYPRVENASATVAPVQVTRSVAAVSPRPVNRLSEGAANSLLAMAHRTADSSQASALFAAKSWYTPPAPPPAQALVATQPTAPPLPFTFLGSYTDGNEVTVYFVTRDDRVYDVKPGDVIDTIYSVAAVENDALVFLYKPLNVRQPLTFGVAP